MSLTLYYHPLSSFCHKALIALYEADIPFHAELIDLGEPASSAELEAVWPMLKFPVLKDAALDVVLPESTIIIEYLAGNYESAKGLVPADPASALEARFMDRFFDGFIMQSMQKVVDNRLRPDGRKDPLGEERARQTLKRAYGVLAKRLEDRAWAAGDAFTLADCAAAPALFYAEKVEPFSTGHPVIARYFDRLLERPSYARVLHEAEPYMQYFPQ